MRIRTITNNQSGIIYVCAFEGAAGTGWKKCIEINHDAIGVQKGMVLAVYRT